MRYTVVSCAHSPVFRLIRPPSRLHYLLAELAGIYTTMMVYQQQAAAVLASNMVV